MADKRTLRVTIRTRVGLVFEGELKALSSVNAVGPFDILPEHINFVSMIKQRLTLHKTDGTSQEMALDNGVLIVEDNKVDVFLGVTKI